jgi:chromosome segregation protein
MQLKTLEMTGFKSFCDKTTVKFQPGVTAIVGPNGCGKSNISDAIRWVLGEQSAKHLRGEKMEDVIFNGSESRKPLGLAEVTLTLGNIANSFSSQFGDYQELEITRRLYRSGESEYLINKIPCRLKDIKDLMMEAGVGAKVHAIIEQDKVDQILSSKPQDRRFLFEEVAGVMKYKARRQEALSKLESTKQNQLRISDIIAEVKRQVNSLDRQAKKAERYQKLRGEMKDLEYRLASIEYSDLGVAWNSTTDEYKKCEDEITALHASLGTIESSVEESRAEALAAEHELSGLRRKMHETETGLRDAEHRAEMSRSRIAALHEKRERDNADLERLHAEAARLAETRVQLEAESRDLEAALETKNARLVELTDRQTEMASVLRSKEQALDEMRNSMLNALAAVSAEKSKIANLETRVSQLNELDAQGRNEQQSLRANLGELSARSEAYERELAEILGRKNAAVEARASIVGRIEQAQTDKKTCETSLQETNNQLAAKNSRLHSLIELEQSLEGYQKGVRTVMAARKEGSAQERLGTIHGLVADMIETEPKYEVAIEAVLGERLQHVVVDSQDDSLKAIGYLRANGGGRSTFIPKAPRERKSEPFVKNGNPGVIGSALSIVKCNENYSSVAQYLLDDVVVVDTMDTAQYLWNKSGFDKTVVTLTGEILDFAGAVTGGAIEAAGTGMLTKRREIKDLELQVASLTVSAAKLESEIATREQDLASLKDEETSLAEAIHTADLEFVHKEKDRLACIDGQTKIEARLESIDAELAGREAQRQTFVAEINAATETLAGHETGHTNTQTEINAIQAGLDEQRHALEVVRTETTDVKMELAALQEKASNAARQIEASLRTDKEIAEKIALCETDITSIAAQIEELELAGADSESRINNLFTALEAQRAAVIEREEQYALKNQALQSAEEQIRGIRNDIEAAQKRLSSCEVRRTELRMKIEHLRDRIRTAYHADLEEIVRELGVFEMDVTTASQSLEDLRLKIDQMGPINVDALQEYTELKERYDLLSTQQNDINESIDNLKATIAKLDGETVELFTQAFALIQEKFKEVFSLLFEGGKAELVMLDENNLLESGIEIIAQPRGKKFHSITLLSGGERALTAIALLFAAFLVKPSPFCMLDEVDAPLDEANVTRFTRLIREMSSRSQFIAITHNKRTMEMAVALYGITMPEPGCSRILSAKLRETEAVGA